MKFPTEFDVKPTTIVQYILGVSLLMLAPVMACAQDHPSVTIDNGKINAKIYLPDAEKGFYKGTRFDWAGVIGKLTANGHTYYDQWFTKTDPNGADFVYAGEDIVAGPASAMTGLPEEFAPELGYADAPVGGTFLKVGVGILRKPQEDKYNHYTHYEVVDGGKRTVKSTKTSVAFTQELMDKSSGYGYIYTKTISLVPGKSQLFIEHTLKNIGTKPIDTRVYDHNFLTLDGQAPGPDFTVKTTFPITAKRPIKDDLGAINGDTITYKKVLTGQDNFSVQMGGYEAKPDMAYDFTIQNTKENAQVHIQGDKPLDSAMLWSMRRTLAIEPYIKVSAPVGQQTEWKYTYTFSPVTEQASK